MKSEYDTSKRDEKYDDRTIININSNGVTAWQVIGLVLLTLLAIGGGIGGLWLIGRFLVDSWQSGFGTLGH